MAALDELISKIQDDDLRGLIKAEFDKLRKRKKFGLVFESANEFSPLFGLPVKVGALVAKGSNLDEIFKVTALDGDTVTCTDGKESFAFDRADLIVVNRLGDSICPALSKIDDVANAPDSNLWHVLIEAENFHALQLLRYLYSGKVDCIYIDPPYNTGARDWKYNNDYVDANDNYRHSKWLAMMERRLALAKELLKPEDSVLIVTIDDYEEAHLIVLLEEIFREHDINPVIINHHPQGGAADNISRTHEYALFVTPHGKNIIKGDKTEDLEERWSLMRGGTDIRNLRRGRPNSFYAIYVDKETLEVKGVGRRLSADTEYKNDGAPEGCIAFYPIGRDGTERVWRYERNSMLQHINDGEIICTPNLTLNVIKRRDVKYDTVFSLWTDGKYNAGTSGTNLIREIFGGDTRFAYPKSLYAVSDCIKFSTHGKPDALIVDFFAGSGTTLHAVNLLNAEDGGRRRCILVTNNEVSEAEAKRLTAAGLTPADDAWQELGIARHVTWQRTVCSIEGHDINGAPLKGTYLGTERAMADGFAANAIFFKLTSLDKDAVAQGDCFKELLAVLWLKAGGLGKCPTLEAETLPPYKIFAENKFAVLLDERHFGDFAEALRQAAIETVFIVTGSNAALNRMRALLGVPKAYRLYGDYLKNIKLKEARR